MKVVILAGGVGSRLSEETGTRPKPMVEIGGMPMIWHIMKIYAHFGLTDFIICLGYKGYFIKEYFANYFLHTSDVTLDLRRNEMKVHQSTSEPWTVTLIDTGENTMTGGRLKRVRDHLDDGPFCFTYGDGVSDVDLSAVIDFHRVSGLQATLTTIQPPGRFGILEMDDDRISGFKEKPQGEDTWINGGFFVLEKSVIDLVDDDSTIWEKEPLETLAANRQLSAYRHPGFWQMMDTLRDKTYLEELWASGKAPWKLWS
ncbi:MAG TPA: glucose-1-phosphate cytidylyltransferase [Thermoanaerobaculia bacterium]|nr:glucose-1-phosphate cytidylyltransferase [Thermoanaerobaculia bacterium]